MRVTNKMLSNNFLRDMRSNLSNMSRIQEQMTSGKEIRRPSDDPFKAERIMQLNTEIDANKQYNSNINDVINWMDTTDAALNQGGNVIQRIRELLVSSGNAGYGPKELGAIKDEINEKIGQFSQVLNTSFDGSYIFGGTRSTTKPVDVIPDGNNKKLIYYKKSGGELSGETKAKVTDFQNWASQSIEFSVGTPPVSSKITLAKSADIGNDIDKLIDNINQNINAKSELNGKVIAQKVVENGQNYIRFIGTTDDIKLSDSTVADLSSLKGKSLGNAELDMIDKKLSVQISQGVSMEYNVNANEIIKYGSDPKDDLRELFKRITDHLESANDSDRKELIKGDLDDITKALDNILKIRAEVGAKQNRMDDAKDGNIEQNFNMSEILSKTEDIDITEKTMEFSIMRTVYMAALQTSAKVIQPTLMDYLR